METRRRILIETDIGGDPDDEQSLVRFLLYANEWEVEGIVCNRPKRRDGENLSPEGTGLEIAQALVRAYGQCHASLVRHDRRYPSEAYLLLRTVPGYRDTDAGVERILAAVDRPDPRPLWYCDWGSDHGSDVNNLKRALDKVLRERGADGYARFKDRIRLSSADAFGEHTRQIGPPFRLWVDTFRPEMDRKRWYHRFSALTARAGGFDVERDVRTGHGPLGARYPTNTTHAQKEGDSMTFLYLVPTGMNDPERPTWGSWAGRYGRNPEEGDRPYYWANQTDRWQGAESRDNTLARWAEHLQNDFKARLDCCVAPRDGANHPPVVRVAGPMRRKAHAGRTIVLDASRSSDPDGDALRFAWAHYPEASGYRGPEPVLADPDAARTAVTIPRDASGATLHLILTVTDDGAPPLTRYARITVEVS